MHPARSLEVFGQKRWLDQKRSPRQNVTSQPTQRGVQLCTVREVAADSEERDHQIEAVFQIKVQKIRLKKLLRREASSRHLEHRGRLIHSGHSTVGCQCGQVGARAAPCIENRA